MRKLNETSTISELLNTFTFGDDSSKGKSISDTIKQSTMFSFWEDIVGAKFAKFSKPTKIKYSKLYVSAKSPVLIQEMELMKQKILKKINTYSQALGYKITDIVFDYKKFCEEDINKEENQEEINYYDNECFENIELDKQFMEKIENNINKINFLNKEQKEKLINKIYCVKKAQEKRIIEQKND